MSEGKTSASASAAKDGAADAGPPQPTPEQMQYLQRAQMDYMNRMRWAQAMQAQMMGAQMPMMGFPGMGMPGMGYGQPGSYGWNGYGGKGKKGKGRGKGGFKGGYSGDKGKGKGYKGEGGKDKEEGAEGDAEGKEEGEGGYKPRPSRTSPIVDAQRAARLRFEKGLLDRIQGYWVDKSDPNITYVVEGNTCSVNSGDGGRGFRNRIGVYGVDLCWDARRFWHYLNLEALEAAGEDVQELEWNPGKDCPADVTTQILWVKGTPPPKEEDFREVVFGGRAVGPAQYRKVVFGASAEEKKEGDGEEKELEQGEEEA